ncbi:MAG: undecaprenyl-diphosphate phosphatase [Candidatus Aminicenantales bacterium]
MSFVEIVLLGIIQGLTEFFPVSSSGHLVLFQNLFGLREPQILADVMLHVGTVISLLIFLRRDLVDLSRSLIRFAGAPKQKIKDPQIKILFYLLIASLPTALIGYFFHDFFISLFASLRAVGAALLITACFLFATRFARERGKETFLHPFLIGILQGAAIVPGFSRSGLTIGGALMLGWKRGTAARFSFLLSIPAILGAALFELKTAEAASLPWSLLLAGTAVAAITGYFALVFLVRLINRGKFFSFAFYCFFAGAGALIISFFI